MASLTRRTILAVDIGTSWIKAVLYDAEADQVLLHTKRTTSSCQVSGLPVGWSEIDPLQILGLVQSVIEETISLSPRGTEIEALTFTGAMHGVMFVGLDGKPLTNLIDWRDRRVLEYNANLGGSALAHLLTHYVSCRTSLNTGCQPASGYGISTLYWFVLMDELPQEDAYLCTIVDFVASQMAKSPPMTDYSLAASTGLFDVIRRTWCRDFLVELGAKRIRLPHVVPASTKVGHWQDIMVLAPSGDHAAAVYAVLKEREEEAHINIGTGSQVAACSSEPCFSDRLETRIGLTGSFLLVSAGAVGGRTIDTWCLMVRDLLSRSPEHLSVTDLLLEAQAVEPGCEGLRMRPVFSGTRAEPSMRAGVQGISPTNFTLGHLTRACLEGMAREWAQGLSVICECTEQSYETVFLTGRLATESDLLRQIVEHELATSARVVKGSEVSALGAAQHAAHTLWQQS